MESELIRLVDSIHRDKSIDKELIFESIQESLEASLWKKYRAANEITVMLDREIGTISALIDGKVLDPKSLGRIAAHSMKLVFSGKLKTAERDVTFNDFVEKKFTIIMGTVLRIEAGFIIVNLGKVEGILPGKEQVFNEKYKIGERVRVLVVDVEKRGQKVNIRLSRAHPSFVKSLFLNDVPEIADRIIEIKDIARDPGRRTKIALFSNDERVDCVGSCVGVRGSRIKGIINELNGEKIDIVKWNPAIEIFILNSLNPANVSRIELDKEKVRARVVVPDDQFSLAIGRKGQNIRLASQLTKYHLDVISESDLLRENLTKKYEVVNIPYLDESDIENLDISGIQTFDDFINVGIEGLVKFNFIDEAKAAEILEYIENVRSGEIEGINREDMLEIEHKVKMSSSQELTFNLPSNEKEASESEVLKDEEVKEEEIQGEVPSVELDSNKVEE